MPSNRLEAALFARGSRRTRRTSGITGSALTKWVILIGRAVLVGGFLPVVTVAQEPVEAQLEEIIIVDEVPEAFFAYAPYEMAQKMRRALTAACRAGPRPSLFCAGKPLSFLRAVNIHGSDQQYGFACAKDSLYAKSKYFTPGVIRTNIRCVFVSCLSPKGACEVDSAQLAEKISDA